MVLSMTDLISLINARKKKESERPKAISKEKKLSNLKHWVTFYRRNINIYIRDRLGVRLEPYQHLMIWLMNKSMVFVGICARGAAKSFLLGLYASAMCLLYPHYQVVIVSSTMSQGMIIYNKIKNELCGGTSKDGLSAYMSYLYKKDLIHFRTSDTALEIDFGITSSKIMVLPPLDSSRGARANMVIYDEFRLLKKSDVDSIFEPMGFRRQSDFLNLEEYANRQDMVEEAKSCYISSSGWKTDWLWSLAKKTVTDMLNNSSVPSNLFACDVYLPMQYNRITISQYNKLKSQLSELAFRMEMLNECLGEAEDAYFKLEEFKANQILRQAFRTPTPLEYVTHVDMGNRKKKDNEIRIIAVDFAFQASLDKGANDNTCIIVLCCFWDGEKMIRNVEYIETLEGGGDPVNRIKEIYYDIGDIDYVVFDSKNGGDVYARDFTKSYMHPERGIEFQGFTSAREDELQVANIAKVRALEENTIDPLAIPCLIPVTASQEFNSTIWMDLKLRMQQGVLRFPISEVEFQDSKVKDKKWLKLTSNEHMRIKLPFVQTDMLCGELINLTPKYTNGLVKLQEPRNGYKDRAVTLAYANYIATLIENKMAKEWNDIDYNISEWTLVV